MTHMTMRPFKNVILAMEFWARLISPIRVQYQRQDFSTGSIPSQKKFGLERLFYMSNKQSLKCKFENCNCKLWSLYCKWLNALQLAD